MADISSYIEYFLRLAAEHKEINGFYMMDINEPLDALRSNIKYPALILTSLSGNFEASNLDNILDSVNGGFIILDHLARVDDFSAEMQLVSKMKEIGIDIIARMHYDYLECEPLAVKSIPGFNINSVSYEMLGPVFDNDFGLVFSFKLQEYLNLGLNPSNWERE
jgi:hypothetical protein